MTSRSPPFNRRSHRHVCPLLPFFIDAPFSLFLRSFIFISTLLSLYLYTSFSLFQRPFILYLRPFSLFYSRSLFLRSFLFISTLLCLFLLLCSFSFFAILSLYSRFGFPGSYAATGSGGDGAIRQELATVVVVASWEPERIRRPLATPGCRPSPPLLYV